MTKIIMEGSIQGFTENYKLETFNHKTRPEYMYMSKNLAEYCGVVQSCAVNLTVRVSDKYTQRNM